MEVVLVERDSLQMHLNLTASKLSGVRNSLTKVCGRLEQHPGRLTICGLSRFSSRPGITDVFTSAPDRLELDWRSISKLLLSAERGVRVYTASP